MTIEQEKALKVCEKLISYMTDHTLSVEDIMILIQGILSNDCSGCNWKYIQTPYIQTSPNYQPGLDPGLQPPYRPGDVWCGDAQKISLSNEVNLNSNKGTTTLDKLPNHFKNEKEMIEEVRRALEKNGDFITGEKQPGICAGDNIPDMQYKIH